MSGTATHPAAPAAEPLASADTVLRGIPALRKLPPYVQYLLVMLLTALGGYVGQGAHGQSAAQAAESDKVILQELKEIKQSLLDLDRRVIKIEALREAERGDSG